MRVYGPAKKKMETDRWGGLVTLNNGGKDVLQMLVRSPFARGKRKVYSREMNGKFSP